MYRIMLFTFVYRNLHIAYSLYITTLASIDRSHADECVCCSCGGILFRIRSTSAFSVTVNTCGLNQVSRTSYAIRIALSIAVERKRKWNVGGSSGMLRTTHGFLWSLSLSLPSCSLDEHCARKLAVMPSRSWNADDGTRLLQADYAMPFLLLFISFGDAT